MDVQGQEDGRILDVVGLNNLHGCHMCIVPKHNLEAGKLGKMFGERGKKLELN